MKHILAASVFAVALGGAVNAHAETAAAVVARLVTGLCMPVMRDGEFDPGNVPVGGAPIDPRFLPAMGIESTSAAYQYRADNDVVILEVRRDGCSVMTTNTGDESFLPVLEGAVTNAFARPTIDSDEPHEEGDGLRVRAYLTPITPRDAQSTDLEALAVTYATAKTPEERRMFYVGVLALKKND